MTEWKEMTKILNPSSEITVANVGKYALHDAYHLQLKLQIMLVLSTGTKVNILLIDSKNLMMICNQRGI